MSKKIVVRYKLYYLKIMEKFGKIDYLINTAGGRGMPLIPQQRLNKLWILR